MNGHTESSRVAGEFATANGVSWCNDKHFRLYHNDPLSSFRIYYAIRSFWNENDRLKSESLIDRCTLRILKSDHQTLPSLRWLRRPGHKTRAPLSSLLLSCYHPIASSNAACQVHSPCSSCFFLVGFGMILVSCSQKPALANYESQFTIRHPINISVYLHCLLITGANSCIVILSHCLILPDH